MTYYRHPTSQESPMKSGPATLLFLIISLVSNGIAQVTIEETDGKIRAQISGKPVITYHTKTVAPLGIDPIYARSGFIHPLHSPSGKILTDAFPIGHVHQHAVFNAWTQATVNHEVVDFWNQHKKLGTVAHKETVNVTEAAFEVALQQLSLKKGPALEETWKVSIANSSDPFIIDIAIEQRPASRHEVYLHPFHYGGFGLRGSAHWSAEDNAHFEGPMQVLTGDGIRNIGDSNHTTPRWVAVFGSIKGETAGFVVMDHPTNFRHPQPVRVHPRMPYFVFTPVFKGSFIIKPGFSYQARYRIVTFDGAPDQDTAEAWYQAYAKN